MVIDENEKEDMNFNIYYLNFSKVYEIKMMIDNVIKSSIQRERSDEDEVSKKIGSTSSARLGNKFSLQVGSEISSEITDRTMTSSKLIESLEVINTKSTLLREIIYKCKSFEDLSNCKEGDLLKIDKLNLQLLDEETLRGILLLRKDALKGLYFEGWDINNFISSMLQDYSYIFKGTLDEKNKKDAVIIKIPMELENEFENKYDVSDLLIGHLTLIGVYKKIVSENFIKKNTFTFFTGLGNSQPTIEQKVFPSSIKEQDAVKSGNLFSETTDEEVKYHFIDTIALIQNVHFEQEEIEEIEIADKKMGILDRIINFFQKIGGSKS